MSDQKNLLISKFENLYLKTPENFDEKPLRMFLKNFVENKDFSKEDKKDIMGYFMVCTAAVQNGSMNVLLESDFSDFVSPLSCDRASKTALETSLSFGAIQNTALLLNHPPFKNHHDLLINKGNILWDVLGGDQHAFSGDDVVNAWRALFDQSPGPPVSASISGSVYRILNQQNKGMVKEDYVIQMFSCLPFDAWHKALYGLAENGRFRYMQKALSYAPAGVLEKITPLVMRFFKNSNHPLDTEDGVALRAILCALDKKEIKDALLFPSPQKSTLPRKI